MCLHTQGICLGVRSFQYRNNTVQTETTSVIFFDLQIIIRISFRMLSYKAASYVGGRQLARFWKQAWVWICPLKDYFKGLCAWKKTVCQCYTETIRGRRVCWLAGHLSLEPHDFSHLPPRQKVCDLCPYALLLLLSLAEWNIHMISWT